jgi:hypothetical protein
MRLHCANIARKTGLVLISSSLSWFSSKASAGVPRPEQWPQEFVPHTRNVKINMSCKGGCREQYSA